MTDRSKLSGHFDPGRLVNRITYKKRDVERTETGADRDAGLIGVMTLRSKKVEESATEGFMVMKETEVQYVYHIHRYRTGLKRDMIAVDETGQKFTIIGWTDIAHRRWVRVKLMRAE